MTWTRLTLHLRCVASSGTPRLLSVSKLRELPRTSFTEKKLPFVSRCRQKLKKEKEKQLNLKSAPKKHRHQRIGGQVPHPL